MRILQAYLFRVAKLTHWIRSHYWRAQLRSMGGVIGSGFSVGRRAGFLIQKNSKIQIGSGFVLADGAMIYVGSSGSLDIGNEVFIGRGTTLVANKDVQIGDRTQIAHAVTIIDSDHRLDVSGGSILEQGEIHGRIAISSDVWIGAQAVVLKGVTLGSFTTVGAGSIVTKSAPAGVMIAGNPAIEKKRK